MKIQFLGACQTVTGSKYLLESEGTGQRVLVDCGLFQGLKRLREQNWGPFPVPPASVGAVVLTHAHLDHSGYLPRFVAEGFSGPIYCTPLTYELCRILLLDSARLMEEEAEFANRHGYSKHHPALPLYTTGDVENTLRLFRPVPFHEEQRHGGFTFRFGRGGHILGAAHLRVSGDGRSILFSGDIGRANDPLLLAPEPPPPADYLVIESTYGDRLHSEVDPDSQLVELIRRVYGRRGSILIPVFSVGRAQALLYRLHLLKRAHLIPDLPVFLDSPMAAGVVELYRNYPGEHRLAPEACEQMFGSAVITRSVEESKALSARKDPRIILAASGMATGGRVLHHLKVLLSDRRSVVLLSGYQAPGTRGASLLNGAAQIKIHGHYYPVRAEVAMLANSSAHADARELTEWAASGNFRPLRCFLTHGEPAACDALRLRLHDELGFRCDVPAIGETVDLGVG